MVVDQIPRFELDLLLSVFWLFLRFTFKTVTLAKVIQEAVFRIFLFTWSYEGSTAIINWFKKN